MQFGARLLPVIALSGVVVALFAELAGRVTAVSGLAGFEMVAAVLPRRLAAANLVGSLAVTAMTCAAEVGGLSQLMAFETGTSTRLWALPIAAVLVLVVVRGSFHGVDTTLGIAGLGLFVVIAALAAARPHWSFLGAEIGRFPPAGTPGGRPAFGYTAIAQVASMVVPYQLIFFSSGTHEERFGRGDAGLLRLNAWLGYGVGTLLACSLVVLAAALAGSGRGHLVIDSLADVATMPARAGLGRAADAVMVLGMLAAMSGAALETSLATGYSVAQWRGWAWSMDRPPRRAPAFFAFVGGTLALAGVVIVAGADVVPLTDDSLVLSTVVLPLTYWPVFVLARDRRRMGDFATGRVTRLLCWASLVALSAVAVLAVPALALGS